MKNVLSLTHRKEAGEEFEHELVYLTAPAEQIQLYLEAREDIAYQFYVTEWRPNPDDAIAPDVIANTNGDEWLEEHKGATNGQK